MLFPVVTFFLAFSCENLITQASVSYKLENEFTYYELFNHIDCNHDKCIDSHELNTFMIKVGIPWRCRWPNKVIEYFEDGGGKKNHSQNCIGWQSFKNKIRNTYNK